MTLTQEQEDGPASESRRLVKAVLPAAVGIAVCLIWAGSRSAGTTYSASNRLTRVEPLCLSPEKKELLTIDGSEWEKTTKTFSRMMAELEATPSRMTPSAYLHYLRLCRVMDPRAVHSGLTPRQAIDALLADNVALETFGGHTLLRTRYGARFKVPHTFDELRTRADENHPDQNLACLAEYGVPLSEPLLLQGEKKSLASVLADLVANFTRRSGEFEWTALALTLYLPPEDRWTNRYGQETTFNDLVEDLLSIPLDRRSCGGTHVVYSVTKLFRASQEHDILSQQNQWLLSQQLLTWKALLEKSQRPDGAWGEKWYEASENDGATDNALDLLTVTGHLVEAALCMPEEYRPSSEALKTAGSWLYKELRAYANTAQEVNPLLCPWTHAACAIELMRTSGN